MQIALVNYRHDARLGGGEHSTSRFAQWLIDRGHEVHVVASSFGQRELSSGIIPHLVPRVRSAIGFAAVLEERLRSLDVDIIHDMGFGWYCDIFQPRLGSRMANIDECLRAKPVWQRIFKRAMRCLLPRHLQLQYLMKRQYSGDSRLYLALSKRVKSHFKLYHQVDGTQSRLVYNGIDLDQFSPCWRLTFRESIREQIGASQRDLVLLTSAHDFQLKGVDTAIRAVGQLCRAGHAVKLVVAGRDKRRGVFQQLAKQCGARVIFAGDVPDMVPYYAGADVYVHPTRYDACSRSVLEAIASGLPAVTSACDGSSELITPGCEGFVLQDPTNDRDLANHLRPFLDARLRYEFGEEARQLAEQHSLDRMGKEIEDIYSEVIERKPPKRRLKLRRSPSKTTVRAERAMVA